MAMKRILEAVKKKLATDCAGVSRASGISEAALSNWGWRDSALVSLRLLARLRKASGMSWDRFGKLIDEETEK